MEYQDYFSYSQKSSNEKNEDLIITYCENNILLDFICDGMSSYGYGALAAAIVAEKVTGAVTSLSDSDLLLPEIITVAIGTADEKLWQERLRLKSKFGTTLGGVITKENLTYAFWIGDVKIFQIRNSKIIFESQEHSLARALNYSGEQKEIFGNIVTASLCGRGIDKLTIAALEVYEDDVIIICSDGIWKRDLMEKLIEMNNQSLNALCVESNFDDDHSLIRFRIPNQN